MMQKEVKFKKMVFSDLPSDFALFKQFGITASKMFQNLMALHAVDPANQEYISVEDIYEVTNILASLPSLHRPKTNKKNHHHHQLSLLIQQATLSLHICWSQSRPKQKTTMEKHTGSTAQRRRRLTKRSTFSLYGLQSFWPKTLNKKILCLP